ncbi:MAG: M17 family peptidase N-terminal domain-containing protein, partial [Polaromonas sp.]|nr:M17 family peptidase N-terminal domain-containing protein [Polaromonas sp.]
MDFELKTLTPARICAEKCDALLVLVSAAGVSGSDAVSALASLAIKSGDFEGKAGKLLSAYRPAGIAATRVLFAGVGDGSAKSVRTAVTAAMGALKTTDVRRVVLSFTAVPQPAPEAVRAAVIACADACYVYRTSKSKPAEQKLQRVVVAVASLAASRAGFDKGVGLVQGLAMTREWANRPANYATPTLLAQAAKDLGKLPGIKTEVLGPKEVAKLGMGSFMAVAQGSEEPLRFIVLRYDGGPRTEAPVVLIGKGITFDTGGISIKPAAEMDEMKFDMGGAASVLGT